MAVKVDGLDVTGFESSGYADYIAGITELDCILEGDWDSASSQFSYLAAGSTISNLLLYVSGTSSSKWTISSALVVDNQHGAEVRGLISFTASIKAKGSFSFA